MEDPKKAFGQWLRDLRNAQKMTQNDVVREMYTRFESRVDPAAISGYENGENSPDGRRWWQLLQVYGVEYGQQPAVPLADAPERLARIDAKLDRVLARMPDEGEFANAINEAARIRGDIGTLRQFLRQQGMDIGEQSS